MPANIVQVEFFHIGGPGVKSLATLQHQAAERFAAGAKLKTVVRFYDEDEAMSLYINGCEHLHKRRCSFLMREAKGLWRYYIDWQTRRLTRKELALEKLRLPIALGCLKRQIERKKETAIENTDYTFRRALHDELHELTIAALKATGVWCFLMAPNDLLANNQKVLAKVM